MIAVREYSSAAECIAASAAVRSRIMNAPKIPRITSPIDRRIIPFIALQIPLWEQQDTVFDAHTHDWRLHRAAIMRKAAQPVRTYIEERSEAFGFTYEEMTGESKTSRISAARHLISFEIKAVIDPSISWAEMGRAMKRKDHTSAINSYRKMAALGHEKRWALERWLASSKKISRTNLSYHLEASS